MTKKLGMRMKNITHGLPIKRFIQIKLYLAQVKFWILFFDKKLIMSYL